ncbi:MAG: TRAP transporter TatT component family protein [Alphaproteobacteria bacterium]|nr:TRAP transporter TatT component family protein [Alphaproteobacteria bacterium]
MRHSTALALILATLVLGGGCTVRGYAVDTIGEMLASGDSVFTADEDIELIGGALPFSLKLTESLLAESPENRGLLLTAARGYVLYSFAYVQFEAEQTAPVDLERARHLRGRARRLYLRAFGYAMRGLETTYPAIGEELLRDPPKAVARVSSQPPENIAFLYWGASALGLAISVSKDEAAMLARLPEVEALLQRAFDLNEAYDDGALHEFAVVWGGAVPRVRDRAAIDRHYQRALELSKGRRASLYVAYAVAAALPAQDRDQFRELMEKALAIDLDEVPNERLQTTIAQRRARWLMARSDELFLE